MRDHLVNDMNEMKISEVAPVVYLLEERQNQTFTAAIGFFDLSQVKP